MSEDKEKTFTKAVTTTAGGSGEVIIKELEQGQQFRVKELQVYGEDSPSGDVKVALIYGAGRVIPEEDLIHVVNDTQIFSGDYVADEASDITLYWENAAGADVDVDVSVKGNFLD